jgi:hypothetical protein
VLNGGWIHASVRFFKPQDRGRTRGDLERRFQLLNLSGDNILTRVDGKADSCSFVCLNVRGDFIFTGRLLVSCSNKARLMMRASLTATAKNRTKDGRRVFADKVAAAIRFCRSCRQRGWLDVAPTRKPNLPA